MASRSLATFKVFTFDVVGTLIDFETGIKSGLAGIAAENGVDLDGEAALELYRAERYAPGAGRFPDDLARCYAAIAPKLGLPVSDENGACMVRAVAGSPAFPDSAEALARLSKRYKLVAMTNAQRWVFAAFDGALGRPFWRAYTVDDTGTEKPDPAFFEHVLDGLAQDGIGRQDVLHVAQSQYHDIGVSRRLGLANCWIERRHAQSGYGGTIEPERFTEPDFHFRSMKALADAVDKAAFTA